LFSIGSIQSPLATSAHGEELRPVPKFAGSSVRDPQRSAAPKPAGQALQWRTSTAVAPAQPAATQTAAAMQTPPAASVAAQPASGPSKRVRQKQAKPAISSGAIRLASAPVLNEPSGSATRQADSRQAAKRGTTHSPVRQTQFELPPGGDALPVPPALGQPSDDDKPLPDFFADPFGDEPAPTLPPSQVPPVRVPDAMPLPADPARPESTNGLRGQTPPADSTIPQPVPMPTEAEDDPIELRPAPRPQTPQPRRLEDFQLPPRAGNRQPSPLDSSIRDDASLIRPVAYSCDDFRQSIAEATIQKVSLDISPPFRPDVIELDEFEKLKERFNEKQEVRDWMSVDGRKLGRGRLRDLAYERVVIETDFGTLEDFPVNRISEADLAYISDNWGLPQECLLDHPEFKPRHWTPSKITWKASNLVHKPLYFEEVNLERYGHTPGPFLEPIVSSAHFFVNIAVMPYKMGVHLPNECQYAFGYYRPGNCAPWITPPVPLSLRGALFQTGAVVGTVLLVP
jgi:hypothetical protein